MRPHIIQIGHVTQLAIGRTIVLPLERGWGQHGLLYRSLNQDIPGSRAEVPHTGLSQEAAAVEILQPDINIAQAGLQSSSSVHVSWDLVVNITSGHSYH